MIVEIGGRASGKTTRMIAWALNHPESIILVSDQGRRLAIEKRCPELEGRVHVASPDCLLGSRQDRKVGVDQMADVLQALIGPVDVANLDRELTCHPIPGYEYDEETRTHHRIGIDPSDVRGF